VRKWLRRLLVWAIVALGLAGVLWVVLDHPSAEPTVIDYKVALIADIAGVLAFVAVYTALEPWWNNWVGRFIISREVALALALTPFVLSFFFTLNRLDNDIAAWTLFGSLAAMALILLAGCVIWTDQSLKRRRQRRDSQPPQAQRSALGSDRERLSGSGEQAELRESQDD
jgi:hypothetical protein